jgi:copper chaperone CopZ
VVRALKSLDGVIEARASFPEKGAVVIFEPGRVQVEEMREALLKAGFLGSPAAG